MSESLHQRREGGKRTDWTAAKRPADKPLITIITSTFNAVRDLPWTSDSLWGQTYPYIQWIVADGASTDGTVEWLSQHDELIDVWFSEPDSGIYDAWNKALGYAAGDWIQFVGAGDELAAPGTLGDVAKILAGAYPSANIVYGRLQFISEISRTVLEEAGLPWAEMEGRWQPYLPATPPHPSSFAHRSLFNGNQPFSVKYKIASDQLFMLKAIKEKKPKFTDILVDKTPVGGISGRLDSLEPAVNELKEIAKELKFKMPIGQFLKVAVFVEAKIAFIKFSPPSIAAKGADFYRKVLGKKARWTAS